MNAASQLLAVLTVIVCTPLAPAAQGDARITETASRSIASYARYTVFDYVSAEVSGGIVLLSGKVTLAIKREEIGRTVEALPGVRGVRNDIGILPASAADDALRKKVSRAIYGSAAFWRYASWQNPPIHIIVEHGHVTLVGSVPSETDRAAAQSLATGLGERSLTNALKTETAIRTQLRAGSS